MQAYVEYFPTTEIRKKISDLNHYQADPKNEILCFIWI